MLQVAVLHLAKYAKPATAGPQTSGLEAFSYKAVPTNFNAEAPVPFLANASTFTKSANS